MSSGAVRWTISFILSCTAFWENTVNNKATTPIWNPKDIIQDSFLRPYRPQMSFTATGFEVTSRGGSFGGLKNSLTLRMNPLIQGSSTSATSRCCRCTSAARSDEFGTLGVG